MSKPRSTSTRTPGAAASAAGPGRPAHVLDWARGTKLRVALAAWEIGRANSGMGTKVGGLGAVIEELPPELVKAAARQGLELEIETLSPCFAHYDRRRLERMALRPSATLEGHTFPFEVYTHSFREKLRFPDGREREVRFRMVYFWDELQLGWTGADAIYPLDPCMAAKLYATVCQAMAGYIRQGDFQTIHLHDYHVGLIPFYLGDAFLARVPVHFTIHNASYQGITPLLGGGYATLARLNLPGERLFHKYFDFFDNLNLMKACLLKVHELGGRLTTVSGDLAGTWGYAAELRQGHRELTQKAQAQKGAPPLEVFVPNRHLDALEKIPVAGITNGLREAHWPRRMPELNAKALEDLQARRGPRVTLFSDPIVQSEMLSRDHHFDADHLEMKQELKRLLHLECFGHEPQGRPVLLTVVARMVEQKNLGLVAAIIPSTLAYDPGAKFIILAAAPGGDANALALQGRFRWLAQSHPGRVHYNGTFNAPLAKLILAGGDFSLIPSRFEPCGLVDYEASLLGAIVIGHRTGGLDKVRHCAYLYEWLDVRDPVGEAEAFFRAVQAALSVYRQDSARHAELMRRAMAINAGWDASADRYIELYRFGFMARRWRLARAGLIEKFLPTLGQDREVFGRFFNPGVAEYGDRCDWELKERL